MALPNRQDRYQDQRDAHRHDTRLAIKVRKHALDYQATVVDISHTGMGVEIGDMVGLKAGDRIEVYSETLGCLDGQVRWVRRNRLGIRFDTNSNNAAKIAAFFKFFHR